jgi:sigma-B regulation protein RsbU (phosphoserine phosphatase)
MSNLQATVKAYCVDHVQPHILCEKVNTIICGNISPGKFITFFYAVVDPAARKLTCTNAGHNHPMLMREDGTLQRLERGGAVLGVFRQMSFEQEEVELRRGDRLLLFTDGVSEAFNEDEEDFGEDRLAELLRSQPTLDAVLLQETVLRAVTDFCSGNFHDDATLIALTVLD